jgi:hypothetical protein
MIQHKTYNIPNQIILSQEVLNNYLLKFWGDVFNPINENDKIKHLMVLCKVKYSESESEETYKTLGPLRRVEYKDLEQFKEYLFGRLGILIDSYSSNLISEIVFTFVIKDGEISEKDRLLLNDLSDKDQTFHDFNKIKLPISMDPINYGTIRSKSLIDNDNTRYMVRNNNKVYEIDVSQDQLINKVSLVGSSGLEWTDTKISDEIIKRELGKSTFYFLNGETVLVKKQIPFTRLRSKYNII